MTERPRTRSVGVRSRDSGFTLVELLVAIVVLGVVMIPLADLVIQYFRTETSATTVLGESHDAQIVNAYWQQDVASIGLRSPSYDSAQNTFPLQQSIGVPFGCTSSIPSGVNSPFVVMGWTQYDSSGTPTQITVGYATQGAAAPYALVRMYCSGTNLQSTATLAHDLTAQPTYSCTGTAGCTGAGSSAPTSVSLTLSIRDASQTYTPYSVTLTGQRRTTT